MLRDLASTPDSDASTIEECCKRVRVLCRDKIDCDKCARSGAAAAVVDAMGSASASASVQLQGLAAIVNLCSGEGHDHRSRAVEIGVLPCIVKAMDNHTKYPEVQEMGCIALQNCCYGEDEVSADADVDAWCGCSKHAICAHLVHAASTRAHE